jgi:acetyl-CoA carboxylase biotin carboxyl carrier protein
MSENKSKPLRDRIAKAIRGESTPGVDPEFVRELAKLLEETGLSEIEVERAGVRVRVARGTAAPAWQSLPQQPQPASPSRWSCAAREPWSPAHGGDGILHPSPGRQLSSSWAIR